MTLNPFLGMDRQQLDQCRVCLQLAAAMGSFEAAFEALDRCQGDEEVEIRLWEMSSKELDKLIKSVGFIQDCGGGEQAQQAILDRAALPASGSEPTLGRGDV